MSRYRQYCPIARSSEIIAERWTPLIVRNLLWGATTFTEIARGVPTMSRSILIKRLRELERVGVVEARPKQGSHGFTYHLTPAGRDLAGVTDALAQWANRWLDVTEEHADPGFALWAWTEFHVASDHIPQERTLVEFRFPGERSGNQYFWMLAERGEIEVCYTHPGGEPDCYVTADSEAFVRWHIGETTWQGLVADGSIQLAGSAEVANAVPRWHTTEPAFPQVR